jgi:hypothetical protein
MNYTFTYKVDNNYFNYTVSNSSSYELALTSLLEYVANKDIKVISHYEYNSKNKSYFVPKVFIDNGKGDY